MCVMGWSVMEEDVWWKVVVVSSVCVGKDLMVSWVVGWVGLGSGMGCRLWIVGLFIFTFFVSYLKHIIDQFTYITSVNSNIQFK